MKRAIRLIIGLACLALCASPAEDLRNHLFICRTPVLAFDFWEALENLKRQGTTLTPKIAEDVCNAMRHGDEPQCIRVEAFKFRTLGTGPNGALAIRAGNTKTWFHNPDSRGWVHPDYWAVFLKSNAI